VSPRLLPADTSPPEVFDCDQVLDATIEIRPMDGRNLSGVYAADIPGHGVRYVRGDDSIHQLVANHDLPWIFFAKLKDHGTRIRIF
jgi:hypothetical protein